MVRAQETPGRIRLAVCGALLAIYTGVVLTITMWPTQPDQDYASLVERFIGFMHRNRVPEWFGFGELEFTANIAMFVPLGFLLALTLPARASWLSILLLPAFSGMIELTQGQFLTERFATLSDVVANTSGGYVGALLALGLRAVVHERDRRVIARALAGLPVR
jgi:glycopeptide antibiotics resistance protein